MPSTDDFVAAGLYDPATQATTGRLELLEWLDGEGFTVAEMQAGLVADSLGAMAGDRRVVPGKRMSRDAAIAQSGLAADEFDSFARAFGFLSIDSSDVLEFTREEVETLELFETLATMFSHDEAVSFVRVVGSSIGRIADAAVSLFLADVESRLLVDGSSELDLAHAVHDAIGLLDGFTAQLDPVLRRHVLQAVERSRRATIGLTERFQYRYAVGFVDLVGFTAISGEMPPKELARFLRDFEGQAYDIATQAGARVVKLIGDEVMFVASDASAACVAARNLMDGFGLRDDRIVPRGGLALGEVLVRGGDYYGSVVNLASRLADEAEPRELLVTSELAQASEACDFELAGQRTVKGFAEPIDVHSFRI